MGCSAVCPALGMQKCHRSILCTVELDTQGPGEHYQAFVSLANLESGLHATLSLCALQGMMIQAICG